MNRTLLSLVAAGALLAATAARADLVTLTDGRTIEGKIVHEDENEIKIELARGGGMNIPRAKIAEIVRQKSSIDILEEKLLALHPDRPGDYFETGKWCIDELKRDDIGVRLITLAMALDPQYYVQGQMTLGDFLFKKEKRRAAPYFVRALLAAPENEECKRRFEQVKEQAQDLLKGDDRALLRAFENYQAGDYEESLEAFKAGKRSGLRPRAEQLLGGTFDAVIAFCAYKIPCSRCQGALKVPCPDCKGVGAKDCDSCGGDGTKKRTSAKGTEKITCKTCLGWGNILCKKCKSRRSTSAGAQPNPVMNKIIEGAQVACPVCKGKPPVVAPQPRNEGVQAAFDFLTRRLTGNPTPFEQTETRMVRVGGAARVEGSEELVAAPVWWNDEWVSLEQRQKEDPSFHAVVASEDQEFTAVRTSSQPFQPDASGPAGFAERIRQTFGVGPVSQNVAQLVYVTDFANRAPEGDQASSGPWVEIDADAAILRAGLAQVGQAFGTSRVTISAAGTGSIPLPRLPEIARLAENPGLVVRLYYSVADSKEDVLPQPDRDVCLHLLTVKLLLIDFVDSNGRVVKSAR